MSLDPDDPRPPFQQVRSALRAAILTGRIASGEKLPTQAELAKTYGVAPMTIQQALRLLKDEGLVLGRQGMGTFARSRQEPTSGPQSRVDLAFERPEVTIDFVGHDDSTLDRLIAEPLEKVRSGRLVPESVRVRVLLVETERPSQGLSTRGTIEELASLGLVPDASVDVGVTDALPGLRLVLLNGNEVLHGFSPLADSHSSGDGTEGDGREEAWVHAADDGDPDSNESRFVADAGRWFDAVWTTLTTER
jgi:DNA-binding transcriptional regulator YhcF (GntR family)